jgi:hypothetical protein
MDGILHKYTGSEFGEDLLAFTAAVDRHLDSLTPDNAPEDIIAPESYQAVEASYKKLKNAILAHTAFGNLEVADMDDLLQFVNQVKRGCRHLWKAARRLNSVRESLQRNPAGEVVGSDTPDRENIEKLQGTEETLAAEGTDEESSEKEKSEGPTRPS